MTNVFDLRGDQLQIGDVLLGFRRETLLHRFGESDDGTYVYFAVWENSRYTNVTKKPLRVDDRFTVLRTRVSVPPPDYVQALLAELLAQNTRREIA